LFIIFGWMKENREVGAACTCHCYRCQGTRTWVHWKVTEWVTFFAIKTIPFLSKSRVVCSSCRESISLSAKQAGLIGADSGRSRLGELIEEHQLSRKSEVQRRYLLSQREQNTSR
jgi:hypothetical protein